MTLLPLMQFHFDTAWPAASRTVFMTATKVWGPLSAGALIALLLSVWWVALIGLLITGFIFWVDPRFYEEIDWKDIENLELYEVMD